jgi:hypothetical protein
MAMRQCAIRLDVQRIVIDGLRLSNRDRFARAFEAECTSGLAAAEFKCAILAGDRIAIRLAHDATPETIGKELAREIVRLVSRP